MQHDLEFLFELWLLLWRRQGMFAALSLVCQKQRTGWGVHYMLMDLCAGVWLYVCLWCVAERGCGAGVV